MYERPILITGMPRSGTSWVAQIVESCPRVRYRMSPLFSYTFKNRIREGATREQWDEVLRGAYLDTRDEFMSQAYNRRDGYYPVFAERDAEPAVLAVKFNRFQNLLEEMIQLLPELRVVAVVRHPCGAIHSWLTAPREFPQDADPLEHWRSGAIKKTGYGDYFGFDDWKWVTRLHLRLADEHPDRFRVARYERLVSRPMDGTRELFAFFDLPLTEQTEAFVHQSNTVNVEGAYSVFKSPAVKDRWRSELHPRIRDAIVDDLRGTDLETFLDGDPP